MSGHNKRHEVMNMNVIWKRWISGEIGLFTFMTVNRNRQVTLAHYLLFLPFCLQVWSLLKRKPDSLFKTCSAGEIKIICHPADSRKPNQTKLRRPQRRSKHVPGVPPYFYTPHTNTSESHMNWAALSRRHCIAVHWPGPRMSNCSTANLTPRSHWARF